MFNGTITGGKMILNDQPKEQGSSPFIKMTELPEGQTVTILGNAREKDGNYGVQLLVDVEIKGQKYTMPINPTTRINFVISFGNDTESWNGKEVRVKLAHSTKYNKTYKVLSAL